MPSITDPKPCWDLEVSDRVTTLHEVRHEDIEPGRRLSQLVYLT